MIIFSGILAGWFTPEVKLRSALQHLAAGIIFASVATEMVPELLESQHVLPILLGFVVGIVLVYSVRYFDESTNDENRVGNSKQWLGLLVAAGVDMLVDGFLMGVAFSVAESSGIILTIAIAFEVLFLGFTFTVTFQSRGLQRMTTIGILIFLSVLLFLGSVLGYWLLGTLEPQMQSGAMAFGCIALLYLVIEELLVEAHESGETSIGSMLFFLGFGAMLIAAMMI